MEIQPWDALKSWLTPEQYKGYLLGTAIAYFARAGKKGPFLDDIQKGHHTIEWMIENLEQALKDEAQEYSITEDICPVENWDTSVCVPAQSTATDEVKSDLKVGDRVRIVKREPLEYRGSGAGVSWTGLMDVLIGNEDVIKSQLVFAPRECFHLQSCSYIFAPHWLEKVTDGVES
jgi:hypothetical protein